MDFRQEYKNSAEIMNPSSEAMERMKRNILENAARPEKKVFPFKKLAYAGSALAACAVIAVAAANVLPSLTAKNEIAHDAANSESAVYAIADCDKTAGAENLSAAQDTAADYVDYSVQCNDAACEDAAAPVPQMTTAVTTYNEPKGDNNMTEAVDADAPYDEDGYAAGTTHTHIIGTLEMSADRSHCIIGETEYVLVPPERLTQLVFPEDASIIEYPSLDGETYTVFDYTDFVHILCGDVLFGVYCTPDMFDVIADPLDLREPVTSTETAPTTAPDIDEEFMFEMSADGELIIVDDVTYILTDDGTQPPTGVSANCMNLFLADGTEYWLDFYGDDYLVLTKGNECLGGYTKE